MKVCILGAGAFGLCLGIIAQENNHSVKIWTKFDIEKEYIINNRKSKALPGVTLDSNISVSTDIKESIEDASVIVVAIPVGAIREVISEIAPYINKNHHICIASKGIEQDTCLFISDIVRDITKSNNICVISGPTFAIDVANKYPIGLSLASKSKKTIDVTKEVFQNSHVKLKETNDLIGVELCGSIKNVIALASGILSGMNLPISTQAMFITSSVNEIKYLIRKLGGDEDTITSLAGFGDILLTCTSTKSRNYTFGTLIGSNCSKEIVNEYLNDNTVEGLYTLDAIYNLIKNKKINIDFINILYDIINHDVSCDEILNFIM